MPSAVAWAEVTEKRLDLSGSFVGNLGPEDSIAGAMVRRAKTPDGLRRLFGGLTDDEVETLVYDLDFWARRQQIPPSSLWEVCVALAGRGFGKTWMGARWVISKAREGKSLGALVGPTAADVRDTMIRGSSGILALSPPWFMPVYEPSKRRVTWPNGVYAVCYSADKPDRLRGPNCGWSWGDEPASWKHEMAALDQLPLVLRIGTKARPPQMLLTGTPRPIKKLAELIEKPGTVLVTGSSLANRANLAPTAIANMRAMAHTRWGRQEVQGLLLMDVPGAIFGAAKWGRVQLPEGAEWDAFRVHYAKTQLDRRVVAIDPAPTSDTGSDESGIIVEGVKNSGLYGPDGYPLKKVSILEDASMHGSPLEWARRVVELYIKYECDRVVAEVNSGGEMVETTIQTAAREMGVHVEVKTVRAKEHKSKRAEPVSALAETGRIELVGEFARLEKQLSKFTGVAGRRDDRPDAMCWGVHDLVFADQFFCL